MAVKIRENDHTLNAPSRTMDIAEGAWQVTNRDSRDHMWGFRKDVFGIDDRLLKRSLYHSRHRFQKFHELLPNTAPEVLRFVERLKNGVEIREQFIFEYEFFTIFTLSSELYKLQNGMVYMDGTFSLIDHNNIYKQCYILSHKMDIDNRTLVTPVCFCLMKNRKKETYIQFFKELKNIFELEFPLEAPLSFSKVSCDFEKAAILAILLEMSNVQMKLCMFHFIKFQRDKIQSISKENFMKVAPLRRLFSLIRSIPYVPWVSKRFLINVFFLSLNGLKLELHESMHADFDSYTDYLKRNYFTDTNFKSFVNFDYQFEILYENNTDCTNNSAEAINSKFNSRVIPAFKSYYDICRYIYNFKKNFYEDKTLSTLGVNLYSLKKRPPQLIRRSEIRRQYVIDFVELFDDEMSNFLLPFMYSLQEIPCMGPFLPLRAILYNNLNFA